MLAKIKELKKRIVIGFVGGSDLSKQQEQLDGQGIDRMSLYVLNT